MKKGTVLVCPDWKLELGLPEVKHPIKLVRRYSGLSLLGSKLEAGTKVKDELLFKSLIRS